MKIQWAEGQERDQIVNSTFEQLCIEIRNEHDETMKVTQTTYESTGRLTIHVQVTKERIANAT
jgi:hypothetical protein